jgi:hypothetical protein
MIDDDLDAIYERAWDDGYRAAVRVLLEADEAIDRSSSTRSRVDDYGSSLRPTPRQHWGLRR